MSKGYVYGDGVRTVWVIGNYEGELAKRVLAQAHSGVGYIILKEAGSKIKPACLVAFRIPINNGPIPIHLQKVTDPHKIAEYERIRNQQQGLTLRESKPHRKNNKSLKEIFDLFESKRVKAK